MGDQIAQAEEFKKKAEKKLSGWGLFGSKYDAAADLFDKAANSYKLAKSWDKAGATYFKLDNCHLKVLAYHDLLGMMQHPHHAKPVSVPPISKLGLDALLESMVVDEFHKSLSRKKISIKALLLDQSFISSIGNWIANEVLYQARIHPLQMASSLSPEKSTTLHKCIKEVIEKAVDVGADSSQFPTN